MICSKSAVESMIALIAVGDYSIELQCGDNRDDMVDILLSYEDEAELDKLLDIVWEDAIDIGI